MSKTLHTWIFVIAINPKIISQSRFLMWNTYLTPLLGMRFLNDLRPLTALSRLNGLVHPKATHFSLNPTVMHNVRTDNLPSNSYAIELLINQFIIYLHPGEELWLYVPG